MKSVNTENLQDLNFSNENIEKLKRVSKYGKEAFIDCARSIDKIFYLYIQNSLTEKNDLTISDIDVSNIHEAKVVLEVLQEIFGKS
ncbi:hypothetical protein [Chryseobacterium binzhouense]|uniref:hypothetical protein n=1 Tax=Chryseobacterium binzhouense TaxID=2593646 RepID=UPI0028A0D872|nr:hypothetical protein [Chryseobacterium binzhouense]